MSNLIQGRIIEGRGGFYTVEDEQKNRHTLRARGRFRIENIKPLVGDRVTFDPPQGEEEGWIEEILPRSSQLIRPPAANIELMLITVAPVPMVDLLLIDRMLVRARQENIQCAIVYNKVELNEDLGREIGRQYEEAGVSFFLVSALTTRGIEDVRKEMQGKLCCMAGQSGVGKSTLLNTLLGLELETGAVSAKTERGKHTTRHTTLIDQNGLTVLDTPGFSLLDLDKEMEPVDLKEFYPEFLPYDGQCYFQPCYHETEPGCKVLEEVKEGTINAKRVERYHTLLGETKESWRGRYD
ncbi:MAG: ribosome small subunit-dependent GTPase A [Clostridiales bacterium]|nr:ribosome small subunit-dependent GTPase A [Clostridiales bacterium]